MRNLIVGLLLFTFAITASAGEGRNVAEYNLNSAGTGFINGNSSKAQGYDPVSLFPEGGGTALVGKSEFALDYEGVEYLFANAANMKKFLTNQAKYEPTYGGYCARAMVVGQKVHINTRLSTVVGNRSFFFVNSRAKRFFDRDIDGNAKKADQEWKRISGEEPRL
jgi:YHS domain-containing protein